MISIFSDLLEGCMEVFMDDFMIYAESFDACLENLSRGLCWGTLYQAEGSKSTKLKSTSLLPYLTPHLCGMCAHSWDMRFIKNFSKIALPLSKLLEKEVDFVFDKACEDAFQELKTKLTSTPILQAPNWKYPFELMYDASNSALEAVLGQQVRVGKPSHVIAYASQTMDPTQMNYTTTEEKLVTIVFALDKFRSYLLSFKVIVFYDHLRQLLASQILVLYLLDRERHLIEASCTTVLAWNACNH
ncbi:Retrovirus-related Pol polyprotein from transposon 17.6, partial [Mucuna pruriens]